MISSAKNGSGNNATNSTKNYHDKEYFLKNVNHNFICWLAEYDGEVVGSSGFNIFQRLPYEGNLYGLEGYIMNIYTLPQYRRKGVSTAIVQEIINYSKKAQIMRLWLHATFEGKYVYSKLGFKTKDSEMELTMRRNSL